MIYEIDQLSAQLHDKTVIHNQPIDIGVRGSRLSAGRPFGESQDLLITIDEEAAENFGSIIPNTLNYLIVRKGLADLLLSSILKVESLPVSITKKGRTVVSDYFILNPLDHLDLIDRKKSDLLANDEGKILTVKKFVAKDEDRVNGPTLFRVANYQRHYFINDKMASLLQNKGFNDLYLIEINND